MGKEAHLAIHDILPVVCQAALEVGPPPTARRRTALVGVRVERRREREREVGVFGQRQQVRVDLHAWYSGQLGARESRGGGEEGTDVEGQLHVVVVRLPSDARHCERNERACQLSQTVQNGDSCSLPRSNFLPSVRARREGQLLSSHSLEVSRTHPCRSRRR